jgi:hypothetical protein
MNPAAPDEEYYRRSCQSWSVPSCIPPRRLTFSINATQQTVFKLYPRYFTKQLSAMSTFASRWMLVFLAAMELIQGVCDAASTPPLENGVFVLKQVVVNATEVPFAERYTMTFEPTTNLTEWTIYTHIANNMWSTMEIDSTITTVHNHTIMSVTMLPGGTTLMMPYGEAADVEMAISQILPGISTAIVEEKDDSSMALTVSFLAGNGTSILVLDQDLS